MYNGSTSLIQVMGHHQLTFTEPISLRNDLVQVITSQVLYQWCTKRLFTQFLTRGLARHYHFDFEGQSLNNTCGNYKTTSTDSWSFTVKVYSLWRGTNMDPWIWWVLHCVVWIVTQKFSIFIDLILPCVKIFINMYFFYDRC